MFQAYHKNIKNLLIEYCISLIQVIDNCSRWNTRVYFNERDIQITNSAPPFVSQKYTRQVLLHARFRRKTKQIDDLTGFIHRCDPSFENESSKLVGGNPRSNRRVSVLIGGSW